MPGLDKDRITGFGQSVGAGVPALECPAGHELQRWNARAGICDGCHKKVGTGEQVMDCRRCDWYLCRTCCPRVQDPTLWGAVSSAPFYAMESAMGNMAWVAWAIDNGIAGQSAGANLGSGSLPAVHTEAAELINDFCQHFSEDRLEPTPEELQGLWLRCSVLFACTLQPGPLASAICQQLVPRQGASPGEAPWQPQFRALCVLELFHERGGLGKEVCDAVSSRAAAPLRRLAELPRCQERSAKLFHALGMNALAAEAGDKVEWVASLSLEEGGCLSANEKAPASAVDKVEWVASLSLESKANAKGSQEATHEPADLIDLSDCTKPGPAKEEGGCLAAKKKVLLQKARLGAA